MKSFFASALCALISVSNLSYADETIVQGEQESADAAQVSVLSSDRAVTAAIMKHCLLMLEGMAQFEPGDEALANKAGLSLGAPVGVDHRDLTPLALGIRGGAQMFEVLNTDTPMAIANGALQCRIGYFDKSADTIEAAVRTFATGRASPWVKRSTPYESVTQYEWNEPGAMHYIITVQSQPAGERLNATITVAKMR